MFINDIPLSDFNAKLLKRQISPPQISIENYWPKKALRPFISKVKGFYYKTIQLEIEFKGTPSEIEINKSRVVQALTSASVAFKRLEHVYTGLINGTGTGEQVNGYEVLSIELLVYEHEDEQEVNINRSLGGIIYLDSNYTTPVIVELLPSVNLASLTITGLGKDITLSNLTAGMAITIDGEQGLVTENGLNKWLDYDSWSYPKLTPGENNIVLSDATLDTKIRFSPRWA